VPFLPPNQQRQSTEGKSPEGKSNGQMQTNISTDALLLFACCRRKVLRDVICAAASLLQYDEEEPMGELLGRERLQEDRLLPLASREHAGRLDSAVELLLRPLQMQRQARSRHLGRIAVDCTPYRVVHGLG